LFIARSLIKARRASPVNRIRQKPGCPTAGSFRVFNANFTIAARVAVEACEPLCPAIVSSPVNRY
jgi:hypothetical protein